MSRFHDFREPVEYIVDQYFRRQNSIRTNIEEDDYTPYETDYIDEELPAIPVTIIRDDTGKAYKFIYGDLDELLENEEDEGDPTIWQQELIRNDTGTVIAIKTTYPDGEEITNKLIEENGKLTKII